LAERTSHREEYVAKLAILEEQLSETNTKLLESETLINDLSDKEKESSRSVAEFAEKVEQERKIKEDLEQTYLNTQSLMNETLEKLKAENESLNGQINVLQSELSKMGQDLLILQKQDTFKALISAGNDANTSISSSDQSSSNLLEINRYLRTQKELAEEKYDDLKLTSEINQQRLLTIENDLDFYKRQSQGL